MAENEVEVNEGSFAEKTVLQRASIIFAGPFFNFLGCIGFLVVLFLIIGVPTTKVGTLVDNAPAQAVGIKVGDEIKEVNNCRISYELLAAIKSNILTTFCNHRRF